jgi:ketosteroid isomerase-like protein
MRTMTTLALTCATLFSQTAESRAQAVSEPWRQFVTAEIRRVLEDYRKAMLSRDYHAMLAFWSDSGEFVFAGDGRILGGFQAWKAETTRHYQATRKWDLWEWQNIHVLPISESAASATLEFRFRWVDTKGATHNARGAWTYVFMKVAGKWKVVHTNGTHIEL